MKSTLSDSLSLLKNSKANKYLVCNRTFNQKNLYRNHLQHEKNQDAYNCNICGKSFAVPARLTRHYRTHTGEKPFQCEYCEKSFSVKENLSVHRRIHTKERPYKCDICEKAFEHSGKLHRHMRIHTGERPHKCLFCNKTFIQSGQLVIHMRTHTGEKPYICNSCGKGFTCSKQLKVHSRTHTGEKPYKCNICNKSFGYNHVLKLHQAAHYGEKFFRCILCQETFSSKKLMELHVKAHPKNSVNYSQMDTKPTVKDNCGKNDLTNKIFALKSRKEPTMQICDQLKTSEVNDSCKNTYENFHRDLDLMYNVKNDSKTKNSHNLNEPVLNTSIINCTQNCQLNTLSTHCFKTGVQMNGLDSKDNYYSTDSKADSYSPCQIKKNSIERNKNTNTSSVINISTESLCCINRLDKNISNHKDSLNLPPRKRCKLILQSMETDNSETFRMQRCSSVIKYAKGNNFE